MQRLPPGSAFASLVVASRLLSAAPLVEGNLDAGAVRINWQVYEATDADNPRPLANEFTYLYWLEPTGEGVTLYTFSLPSTNDPLVVGLPRPITMTGVISGTGAEP